MIFLTNSFVIVLVMCSILMPVHPQLLHSSILEDTPTTSSRVREVFIVGERHSGLLRIVSSFGSFVALQFIKVTECK